MTTTNTRAKRTPEERRAHDKAYYESSLYRRHTRERNSGGGPSLKEQDEAMKRTRDQMICSIAGRLVHEAFAMPPAGLKDEDGAIQREACTVAGELIAALHNYYPRTNATKGTTE